jgi:hypothetical protein
VAEPEPECEFDGPWKEAIGEFFEDFLRFFFAPVHAAVDWSRGHEFLDKELEKLARGSEAGRGTVDKLVRVWLLDGSERWVLVHVEVQNQPQAAFAERMYTYNHRLRDYYGRMPVSVAVLGDEQPGWRPTEFVEGQLGCEVRFRFLTAKLLEWTGREDDLAADANPFAAVTVAHLKTLETRGRPDARSEWKRTVARGLYDRGFGRERVRRLFRVIDWIMALSPPRQAAFVADHTRFEEDRKMPFVSPTEQLWMDRGAEKGKLEAIESILDVRFGAEGVALMPRVRTIRDLTALSDLHRLAVTADLAAIAARLPAEAP